MMLDNYPVPRQEFRVAMSMQFDAASLGAQTSATDSAHKGIKPKEFNVSFIIPFDDASAVRQLLAVAEATNTDGSLHVYDIVSDTANACNVRQVRFTDSFRVVEEATRRCWSVSFTLREFLSIAEKAEQRIEKSDPVAQAADGTTVTAPESGDAQADDNTPKTSTEKFLANIDKALS